MRFGERQKVLYNLEIKIKAADAADVNRKKETFPQKMSASSAMKSSYDRNKKRV